MPRASYCKLEIFIPESCLPQLQRALCEAGAGRAGNYECCMAWSAVTGCFRPLEGAAPFIGGVGELCTVPELKVEVNCLAEELDRVIWAVRQAHPYEEPVINAIPIYDPRML